MRSSTAGRMMAVPWKEHSALDQLSVSLLPPQQQLSPVVGHRGRSRWHLCPSLDTMRDKKEARCAAGGERQLFPQQLSRLCQMCRLTAEGNSFNHLPLTSQSDVRHSKTSQKNW